MEVLMTPKSCFLVGANKSNPFFLVVSQALPESIVSSGSFQVMLDPFQVLPLLLEVLLLLPGSTDSDSWEQLNLPTAIPRPVCAPATSPTEAGLAL